MRKKCKMPMRWAATTLAAFALALTSCGDELLAPTGAEGYLQLNVTPDLTLHTLRSESESTQPDTLAPWEDVQNYSLLINRDQQPYAGFDKLSDLPEGNLVKLQPADYTVVAWWGENLAAGFDCPFYYGESEATILEQETTPVEVTATLFNARVEVVFTDPFRFRFQDYKKIYLQLHNEYTEGNPLNVKMDETRTPYVAPSPLYLRLMLTKADGTQYSYGLCTVEDVQSQDNLIVTLDADVDPSTGSFQVTINDATNRVDVSESVPYDAIVKALPEAKLSFATPFESIEEMPEESNAKIVYVKTAAGLQSLVLNHTSAPLTEAGIPSGASLLDANVQAQLRTLGIAVDAAAGNERSFVDFTQFIATTSLGDADEMVHDFEVVTTDYSNITINTPFAIHIILPVYGLPAVLPGDIWSHSITLSPMVLERGDADIFAKKCSYDFSTDGGATWSSCPIPPRGTYDVTDLQPNTDYLFRCSYKGNSDTLTLRTYGTPALPNGDLEAYKSAKQSFGKSKAPIYDYTFTSWCTNNGTTLSPKKKHNYNNWPSTESVTDASTNKRAAVVQSVAYGSNTCVASGYIIDKVAPGILALGGSQAAGVALNARPTALTYDYKLVQQNNRSAYVEVRVENRTEGVTTVLGKGVVTPNAAQSSYKKASVAITYDAAQRALAPTHICVIFRSTKETSLGYADVKHYWGKVGAFTWPLDEAYLDTKYLGNRFWIDNIVLEYNK